MTIKECERIHGCCLRCKKFSEGCKLWKNLKVKIDYEKNFILL